MFEMLYAPPLSVYPHAGAPAVVLSCESTAEPASVPFVRSCAHTRIPWTGTFSILGSYADRK